MPITCWALLLVDKSLLVQGSQVGENTFIDSLDFMDHDLLEVGDQAVIGEGATAVGHMFEDGALQFSQVNHSYAKTHSLFGISMLSYRMLQRGI